MNVWEILTEARNVVNVEEIEGEIQNFVDRTDPLFMRTDEPWKAVRDWFKKALRRYLLVDHPEVLGNPTIEHRGGFTRVKFSSPNNFIYRDTTQLPPWFMAKHEAGEDLVFIDPFELSFSRDRLGNRITPVWDWFRHLAQNNDPVLTPHRLSRMTLQQAEQAAQRWHAELAKQAEKTLAQSAQEGEKPVLELSNGYRWVQLTTPQALNYEGKAMGHCVGSYADDVAAGTEIYSLRDPENRPHVTIEAERGTLDQIKGKQNEPPVEKYWPMVDAFITAYGNKHKIGLGFGVTDDLQGCGLVVHESRRRRGEVAIIRPSMPLKGSIVTYREIDYQFDENGSGDYTEEEIDNVEMTFDDLENDRIGKYCDGYEIQIALALVVQGWWRRSVSPSDAEYEYENLEVSVFRQGGAIPYKILYGEAPDEAELEPR
jgi:hypothetical protein